jgi:hypothetical protein
VSEYTKGPWRIDLYGDHNERFAIEGQAFDGTWRWIVDRVRGGNKSQTVANARFITAAPEMAEMLRGKVLAALRQPQAMDIEGVCEDVEELLRKAGVL